MGTAASTRDRRGTAKVVPRSCQGHAQVMPRSSRLTNRRCARRIGRRKGERAPMSKLDFILEELVTANRILAHEGVVDSFGHVSARHPDNPQHYLLSRARAPERIEPDDIVEYELDGTPIDERGRTP